MKRTASRRDAMHDVCSIPEAGKNQGSYKVSGLRGEQ